MTSIHATATLLSAALLLGGVAACGDDHDHGGAAGEQAHGHPHDEGEAELPGQSVTLWSARTELFMEFKPMIIGQETGFAAHVTEMPSFKAVTAGSVTVTVTYADGTRLDATAASPSPTPSGWAGARSC